MQVFIPFLNTFLGDMTYKGCKYSDGQELIGDKGTWQVTAAVVNLRQGDLAGNNSCSQSETREPGRYNNSPSQPETRGPGR